MGEMTIHVDGTAVPASRGQTILEAAEDAGIYIPRLCHMPGLEPYGGCRLCIVSINGRKVSACTQPATATLPKSIIPIGMATM